MKRKLYFTVLTVMLLSLAGSVENTRAQGSEHKQGDGGEPQKATIVGEVIDPLCYIRHDSRGMEHKKCAEYCEGLGINLAILNEENDEILLVFPVGHADPNEKVVEHIAQRVEVTGFIQERGGLKGIEATTVVPMEGD